VKRYTLFLRSRCAFECDDRSRSEDVRIYESNCPERTFAPYGRLQPRRRTVASKCQAAALERVALAGGLVIPLGFAALVAERSSRWVQMSLRILGSWIAAVCMMLLALKLRG
jgi:hypothetical protein